MLKILKRKKEETNEIENNEVESLRAKIDELTEVIAGKDEVIARLVDREGSRSQEVRHPLINTWEDLKKIKEPAPLAKWLNTKDLETAAILLRSLNSETGEQIASGYTQAELEKVATIMQKMPKYTMNDTKIKRILNKLQEIY